METIVDDFNKVSTESIFEVRSALSVSVPFTDTEIKQLISLSLDQLNAISDEKEAKDYFEEISNHHYEIYKNTVKHFCRVAVKKAIQIHAASYVAKEPLSYEVFNLIINSLESDKTSKTIVTNLRSNIDAYWRTFNNSFAQEHRSARQKLFEQLGEVYRVSFPKTSITEILEISRSVSQQIETILKEASIKEYHYYFAGLMQKHSKLLGE